MRKNFHWLLALAVVLVMPLTMQSGSLASEVLIFGLAAMGCNLLLGYTGLLSFGQGIFFGLGSYTIALTLTRWPLPMPLALAAAVGVPDPVRTEVVKAFVVLREGHAASDTLASEILAFARKRLSAHEAPRALAFRENLPMTTTGKIIRRALRDETT